MREAYTSNNRSNKMQANKLFPLSGTAWNSTVDWVKCCDPLHLGFGREVMKGGLILHRGIYTVRQVISWRALTLGEPVENEVEGHQRGRRPCGA